MDEQTVAERAGVPRTPAYVTATVTLTRLVRYTGDTTMREYIYSRGEIQGIIARMEQDKQAIDFMVKKFGKER